MTFMKVNEIRQSFLDFFASKGHQIVASSPVIPGDDPTLLFTNAGMNQFKEVFLGFDKRPYTRATTAQKCIRAGGKHNDLDNVGYTARHHTFFEMLGNFSFGDYFKEEAIQYAWELLTEVFKLPKDKLLVTVYAQDDEAYDIWTKKIGVPPDHVIRIGDNKGAQYASDNFWMMGDTGPCGPCTEIFYDHGPHIAGGPPGSPEEDGDRFIEIWNNVFMQFNRDEQGVMHPLPKKSVDTGMGLERISAILQKVHSNYEIDLFVHLIAAAKAAVETAGGQDVDPASPSLRVIADHIRACAFTVADGIIPGNAGRGYVLRRITRRAIRHGYKLGARQPFFYQLVAALAAEMGQAYPDLISKQDRITEVILQEEDRFFQTIANGMEILEDALHKLPQLSDINQPAILDGAIAFKLHDTFGFPLDLTADVCRERQVQVDEVGFAQAMEQQRQQARSAGKFKMAQGLEYHGVATQFSGYDHLALDTARVLALYLDGTPVTQVSSGQDAVIVLDQTPFYAESGGQIGDRGTLQSSSALFTVADTIKIQAEVFGHHGTVEEGSIAVGDPIQARVDVAARASITRNHSATHLMHKALREVLGEHVQQKGSLVDQTKTRFDFVHHLPVTRSEIEQIEQIVNAEVLKNTPTSANSMNIEDAQQTGAMMLFGEKYGDVVRVLEIGTSKELCGGTHVGRTGDVGLFKIVAESGVAAGVRRIEAVTGLHAIAHMQKIDSQIGQLAAVLKATPDELAQRLTQLQEHVKTLEKDLEKTKSKMAASKGEELLAQVQVIQGVNTLVATLESADIKTLRETLDQVKNKLQSGVVFLACVQDEKVQMIAGVTPDLIGKVKAGDLVNFVAQQMGGKGGGKPDLAMAGGSEPSQLPAALLSITNWLKERI